jgi:hypothetical protein
MRNYDREEELERLNCEERDFALKKEVEKSMLQDLHGACPHCQVWLSVGDCRIDHDVIDCTITLTCPSCKKEVGSVDV